MDNKLTNREFEGLITEMTLGGMVYVKMVDDDKVNRMMITMIVSQEFTVGYTEEFSNRVTCSRKVDMDIGMERLEFDVIIEG